MKIKTSLIIMVVAIVMIAFVPSKASYSMDDMPVCATNPTSMKGPSVLTYVNGGGIPTANYMTPVVCNASFYEWTTSDGYSTTTTNNRLFSDASIFGCGSAWISVRAFIQGSGYTSSYTKNVTVNCLPF